MALEQKDYCDNTGCNERGIESCVDQALAKLKQKRQEARELERARRIKDLRSQEEESSLGFASLCWAEHKIEGSSPFSGRGIGSAEQFERLCEEAKRGNPDAYRQIFKPVSSDLGCPYPPDEIEEEREKPTDGSFLLSRESRQILKEEELHAELRRSHLNKTTGLVGHCSEIIIEKADGSVANGVLDPEEVKLDPHLESNGFAKLDPKGDGGFEFVILPELTHYQ